MASTRSDFSSKAQSGSEYCIQGVREISAIIVTDDYLCYKEPKILTTFFYFDT